MFALSNNSRPNDIVPLSKARRSENRRKLQIERDDLVEAQVRAVQANKLGMASCFQQLALAVDDRMNARPIEKSVVELVDGT
ncbi:MAG: hypothetical protein SGILL_007845, partial [Bacillariaceae sp.]